MAGIQFFCGHFKHCLTHTVCSRRPKGRCDALVEKQDFFGSLQESNPTFLSYWNFTLQDVVKVLEKNSRKDLEPTVMEAAAGDIKFSPPQISIHMAALA